MENKINIKNKICSIKKVFLLLRKLIAFELSCSFHINKILNVDLIYPSILSLIFLIICKFLL
jgi:hypothetical protein